jgi:hypothetical protein
MFKTFVSLLSGQPSYFLPPTHFISHRSQINSPCRWWQYVPLKLREKPNTLHGAKNQKMNIILDFCVFGAEAGRWQIVLNKW